MMKKLNYLFVALMTMLLAVSCSQDETFSIDTNSSEAMVSFNLELPDSGPQSRAIGDGETVNELVYGIFDEDGAPLSILEGEKQAVKANAFQTTAKKETISLSLLKGKTYKMAFWAQVADKNFYTTTDLQAIEVNYEGDNNAESRDAFFGTETFTVSADATIEAKLNRPFAQINVGVTEDDFENAKKAGLNVSHSSVVIKNAASKINLLTGEATDEVSVTYNLADIPTDPTTLIAAGENYKYLSMSYILVGEQKSTLDALTYEFKDTVSGEIVTLTQGLTSVPVQRNYRTNIVGKLLTSDIDFNITIDPIYDGEYNNGKARPVNINGVYYATIQDAVNNVKDGDVIKVATGTYNEVVKVGGGKNFTLEAAGPNVVIAALDHQSNENSTVKVKGITFDNSLTPAGWFIGTAPNIAPCVGAWGGNLTFEDCAFIVDGTSGKETGVMTWYTVEKSVASLSFNNCTFEGKGGHASARAMQIYGHVNMQVNNCTFNTKKDYTLKYVAENGNEATFSNNTVNNSKNFVQLGSDVYPGSNYTVNISNNTLGNGVNTHKIANPENQTINVDGNVSSVIAEGVVKDANGNYFASSNKGITNAISADVSTINLTPGTYIIPDDAKGKTLTFIGTGNPEDTKIATQDDGSYEGVDYSLDGATVTFENITINTDSHTYTGYARCTGTYKNCVINGTYTLYGDSKFENCTFNVSGDFYNIWTWGAPNATFDRCTFNSDGKAMLLYGGVNTNLTIENSEFNDKGGLTDPKKAAIEIGNDYDTSYTLVVNNTVVNGYAINDKGINTGTTLWANKNSMGKDKLSVTVDGVKVY